MLRAIPGLASLPFALAPLAFSPASGLRGFARFCPRSLWATRIRSLRSPLRALAPSLVSGLCASPPWPCRWGVGLGSLPSLSPAPGGRFRRSRRRGVALGSVLWLLGVSCVCSVACFRFRSLAAFRVPVWPVPPSAVGWCCSWSVVPPFPVIAFGLCGCGAVLFLPCCAVVRPLLGSPLAGPARFLCGASGSRRLCRVGTGLPVLTALPFQVARPAGGSRRRCARPVGAGRLASPFAACSRPLFSWRCPMVPVSPAVAAGLSAFASVAVPAVPAGVGVWCWVFSGPDRFTRCARARRFARCALPRRLVLAWVSTPSGSLLALAVLGFLPTGWHLVA